MTLTLDVKTIYRCVLQLEQFHIFFCFLSAQIDQGKSFSVTAQFDSEIDINLFLHGGLLKYVARTFL